MLGLLSIGPPMTVPAGAATTTTLAGPTVTTAVTAPATMTTATGMLPAVGPGGTGGAQVSGLPTGSVVVPQPDGTYVVVGNGNGMATSTPVITQQYGAAVNERGGATTTYLPLLNGAQGRRLAAAPAGA